MSKVILHIGTHKTGTTTIQKVFWENAELLEHHNVVYPRIATKNNPGHHALIEDWVTLQSTYQRGQSSVTLLNSINDKYAQSDKTVFLSTEEFSRAASDNQPNLAEIRQCLSGFNEIEVYCCLREQWRFIQSIYAELSKDRNPPRPSAFINPAIVEGMCTGVNTDYNLLLDRLLNVFAPEEIQFFNYATLCAEEGGIIGAMLRRLGTSLRVDQLKLVDGGRANQSQSGLGLWIANTLSAPEKTDPLLTQIVTDKLRDVYGADTTPCLFSKSEFDQINRHFAPLNQRLENRRRSVQAEFEFTSFARPENFLFRDAIDANYWIKLCQELLHNHPALTKRYP